MGQILQEFVSRASRSTVYFQVDRGSDTIFIATRGFLIGVVMINSQSGLPQHINALSGLCYLVGGNDDYVRQNITNTKSMEPCEITRDITVAIQKMRTKLQPRVRMTREMDIYQDDMEACFKDMADVFLLSRIGPHEARLRVMCPLCKNIETIPRSLEHFMDDHNLIPWKVFVKFARCHFCGEQHDSAPLARDHIKTHHKAEIVAWLQTTQNNRNIKEWISDIEPAFQRVDIEEDSKSSADEDDTTLGSTMPVANSCKLCGLRFENNTDLYIHFLYRHLEHEKLLQKLSRYDGEKKKVMCALCHEEGHVTETDQDFAGHVVNLHLEKAQEIYTATKVHQWVCVVQMCPCKFANHLDLIKHYVNFHMPEAEKTKIEDDMRNYKGVCKKCDQIPKNMMKHLVQEHEWFLDKWMMKKCAVPVPEKQSTFDHTLA